MLYGRNERELKSRAGLIANVVGLTGGIACGKTAATDALRGVGFTVIDADEISRAMFARGTDGERELCALFPQAANDGALNRAKLRELISRDNAARVMLDGFTHPLIENEIKRELNAAKKPVILSAPLLFESGLSALCDTTVCIYCPRETRINRLTRRDGVDRSAAERMIDAQIPDTERCTLADFIVPSDQDITAFTNEVIELVKALTAAQ